MRILVIVMGTAISVAAASSGFGQAVAEGAMVHANSAAAGAKMGSSVGSALNRAMSRNAEKMQSSTAGKIQYVPHNSSQTAPATNSGAATGPLVITSIRGSRKPCTVPPAAANSVNTAGPAAPVNPPLTTATAAAPSSAPATPPAATTAHAAATPSSDCGNTSPVQRQSKSVINLSFPQ